ncbi:helix-turn-helix domain-containing protein [Rubrobacter marinus]|uniref:helix-turn-helix domain-containing protein n=1 Tax=Rubrobacter marinus TaxID=2653852 RepID=UPI001A9EBD09|nr:XRE family transcriptional regulator [Rubrobacter marinus]
MADERTDRLQYDLSRIGARLRALRKERGWTLEDLAERTGLSRAYLSRLEAGERQPSLSALSEVAHAYGISFSSLFVPEPEAQNGVIFRGRDARMQRGQGLLYGRLSTSDWAFNLQPMRVVVPAERGEAREPYRHEGEQWLYVLSGKLCLELSGEEFVLEPGDAAHFDADQPHRLSALDGRDAEVILVACAVPYLLLRSYL